MTIPKNDNSGRKNPVELWRALKEEAVDDDVEEILAMSAADLDAYIRENGGDPEKLEASGSALGRAIAERRARAAREPDDSGAA
jgi:hypothetical protein